MPISETATRLLVALVAAPVAAAAVFVGGVPLAALVLVVAVAAALEFSAMAERKGARPLRGIGIPLCGALVLAAALAPEAGPDGAGFGTILVAALLATAAAAIWTRGTEGEPLLSIAATLTGSVYAGALLSYGIFLRHLPGTTGAPHATAIVLAPLLLTWASDTFAYFVGRAWGTRKLIPRVSPGKTVQGALGAVVGTIAVAIPYGVLLSSFETYRLGPGGAALFGLLVSVVAQVGDLAESLLKRDAGVKDSGALFPGHGGALDRVDSLLFTLPLAYYFFRYAVGAGTG